MPGLASATPRRIRSAFELNPQTHTATTTTTTGNTAATAAAAGRSDRQVQPARNFARIRSALSTHERDRERKESTSVFRRTRSARAGGRSTVGVGVGSKPKPTPSPSPKMMRCVSTPPQRTLPHVDSLLSCASSGHKHSYELAHTHKGPASMCPQCAAYTPAPQSTPSKLRDTFAFDRVLYRDRLLEVTPSALTHRARGMLVDLDDIDGVRALPAMKPPLLKPRWWQRVAPTDRLRAMAPRRAKQANLLVDVTSRRDYSCRTLALHAERPLEVALAIRHAQSLVY